MRTVLLTGVTGQVGSALAPLLQKNGYRILYLIRLSGEKNIQARLREVLPNLREGMDIAINGDVTLPNAGVSKEDVQKWKRQIDKVVHGAAALSFGDSDAENTRLTNVEGTYSMLRLAEDLCVPDFHYISTAYISGNASIFHETNLDVGQTSFNAYEVSKLEAEMVVHDWDGGKFTIHRLPIVLGDSHDGSVRNFSGYYGVAIPFWKLIQVWRQRWENDTEDCQKNGVKVDESGVVELPLYIGCSPEAVLNMVTSDWVAENLAKLLDIPSENQTYHLVHPSPPKVRWVMETSLKHLGISGIRYDDDIQELSGLLQRMQSGFDRGIRIYQQYIKHGTIFTCDNLVHALGDGYTPPPVIDEALLAKMLDYAMSVNFGQKSR
ncbi:MAG: SDR family oxidoreductase [Gallionella sp.]